MAEKLKRPFTLAEKVYQYAANSGWLDTLDPLRRRRHEYDEHAIRVMHAAIDPKMARLRARLASARRFVLTPEVMGSLGYVAGDNGYERRSYDIGPKLEALAASARLPFPFMWLEYEDGSWGYLLNRIREEDASSWTVTVFTRSNSDQAVAIVGTSLLIGPGGWVRARELGTVDDLFDRMRPNERGSILKLWGMSEQTIDDAGFLRLEDIASAQADTYLLAPLLTIYPTIRDEATEAFRKGCDVLVGAIPFFLNLMVLLNSPLVTLETHVMKGFYQHRLKNYPYLTSNTITLNVAPHRVSKFINDKVAEHLRTKHRAHEVRGFWRHYISKASCAPENHIWTADVDDIDLHHCSRCAGKRRWIREHMRGDASLGFVKHQYSITYEPERV